MRPSLYSTMGPDSGPREEQKALYKPEKDLIEYKEFQTMLEGLDRIERVLPPDHRSINRNLLQLHHLLQKFVADSGPYDQIKISNAKIALSGQGFDSTLVENNLLALRYDIGTGRQKKISPFKGKDTNVFSRVDRCAQLLEQSTIDQISKDAVGELEKRCYTAMASAWAQKSLRLMESSRSLVAEEDKADYRTPSRLPLADLISHKRAPRVEAIQDVTLAGTMMQGAPLARYFDVIAEYAPYRRGRQLGDKFPLVSRMREAISTAENSEEAAWVWDLLDQQLGELSQQKCTQEELLKSYVQRNPVLMAQIVRKSCAYLENTFYGVAGGKRETTLLSLLDSYAKDVFGVFLKDLPGKYEMLEVDGDGWPFYAVIYYLFRTGHYKEAAEFTGTSKYKSAEEFIKYMKIYVERDCLLPEEELSAALTAFEPRGSDAAAPADPYKKALQLILTKQHKDPDNILFQSMEDYLWFYFKIVHTEDDEEMEGRRAAYVTVSLEKFQNSILAMGPSKFNPRNDDPLNYFRTLMLIGLYDEGVKYLADYTTYFAHCVHYAIALNEMGLFPNPTLFAACGISADYVDDIKVSYRDLLMKFVEAIQYSSPKEAVLYISLLHDDEVPKELVKFVVDTGNYELLLDTEPIRRGYQDITLSALFGSKLYSRVCCSVAEYLEKNGRSPEVAMQLYDRVEMQKSVINMWIKDLLQSLENINPLSFSVTPGAAFVGEQMKTAEQKYGPLYAKYERSGVFEQHKKAVQTIGRLEKCCLFYNLVLQGKYEEALAYLRKHRLLPLDPEESLDKYVAEYSKMPQTVREIVPSVYPEGDYNR